MALSKTQEEALTYLNEGWCPACKTAFEERRPGDHPGVLLCANGYTPEFIRKDMGLPDVVRLPRRR